MWLVREQLGEDAELLARDSGAARRAPRAAAGLLRGGLGPRRGRRARCAPAARASCTPTTCSPRSAGARWRPRARPGARVVLHLHQYRLVCAVGVCFTRGAECTRCHGRNTLPGVRLNCRGSVPEALAYGASLALWQRRLVEQADAVVVPSAFARERLRELGAPLPWERVHVLAPPRARARARIAARRRGRPAPAPSRTRSSPRGWRPRRASTWRSTPAAGRRAAGGRRRRARARGARARARARARDVRFARPRRRAELARAARAARRSRWCPSRSAETFGLAAAEAMAAGLPVAASRVGALPELVDEERARRRPATPARWRRRSGASPATARPARAAVSACAPCARPRSSPARWRAIVRRPATAAST